MMRGLKVNKQFTNGVLATLSVFMVGAIIIGISSWLMELESIGYVLWYVLYKPIFTILDVTVAMFFIGIFMYISVIDVRK